MTKNHALLSPSAMNRWMVCPASVQLSLHEPSRETDSSKEGTTAHALAETKVLYQLGMISKEEADQRLYAIDGFIDVEMDYCTTVYAEYIENLMQFYRSLNLNPQLITETRVDLSKWIPSGFGTLDAAVITADRIHVIDFKYGKSVQVDVNNCPQLMLYAGGLLDSLGFLPSRTEITIFQPRSLCGLKEESRMAASALYDSYLLVADWMNNYARAKAEACLMVETQVVVSRDGKRQCQFCPVKAKCAARADLFASLDLEKNPEEMEDRELDLALVSLSGLKRWKSDLQEYVSEQIQNEKPVLGARMVTKIGRRKIRDCCQLFEDLKADGLDPAGFAKLRPLRQLPVTPYLAGGDSELLCLKESRTLVRNPDSRCDDVIRIYNRHRPAGSLLDTGQMVQYLRQLHDCTDYRITKRQNELKEEMKKRVLAGRIENWRVELSEKYEVKEEKKEEVIRRLLDQGYELYEIASPDSLSALSKKLPKDVFEKLVSNNVVVPQSQVLEIDGIDLDTKKTKENRDGGCR